MNTGFQPFGNAMPVMLIQTPGTGMPNPQSFDSNREYVKALKKMLKEAKGDATKKKAEQKPRTFSLMEMAFLLTLLGPIIFGLEVGLAMTVWKIVKASVQ